MDLHRRLIDLLEEAGCRYVRRGGSHYQIWFSPISKRHFPVPYKGHLKDRNLANRILKQAGLSKQL